MLFLLLVQCSYVLQSLSNFGFLFQLMTVRTTAFDKAAAEGGSAAVEAAPACTTDAGDSFFFFFFFQSSINALSMSNVGPYVFILP